MGPILQREMVQMRMKARADEVNQLRHTMKTSGLVSSLTSVYRSLNHTFMDSKVVSRQLVIFTTK